MFSMFQTLAICLAALQFTHAAPFSAVGIPVTNLKASSAFYASTLGFKEYRTIKTPEYDEIILTLPGQGTAGTSLVIMQYHKARDLSNLAGKLVFNVANTTKTVGLFQAAGGKVVTAPGTLKFQNVSIPTAFVKDLDGHLIEINPTDMKF
jgi:catechol 2,3-dioxygenase-like lactoylglutathione lyase family enzyme